MVHLGNGRKLYQPRKIWWNNSRLIGPTDCELAVSENAPEESPPSPCKTRGPRPLCSKTVQERGAVNGHKTMWRERGGNCWFSRGDKLSTSLSEALKSQKFLVKIQFMRICLDQISTYLTGNKKNQRENIMDGLRLQTLDRYCSNFHFGAAWIPLICLINRRRWREMLYSVRFRLQCSQNMV